MLDFLKRKKRVFIMAGGEGKRWKKTGGEGIKQMAPVDGEPVIHRTFRQVEGYEVFLVASPWQRDIICPPKGIGFIDSSETGWWCHGFQGTAEFWGKRNICLLGDVFFSDRAMQRLLDAENLHVLGRREGSPITGGPGETFALTFKKSDAPRLIEASNLAMRHADGYPVEKMPRPGYDALGCPLATPWQLYRILIGVQPEMHVTDTDIWLEHSDFTDDFDTYNEWVKWTARYARRMIKEPKLPKHDGELSQFVFKDEEGNDVEPVDVSS